MTSPKRIIDNVKQGISSVDLYIALALSLIFSTADIIINVFKIQIDLNITSLGLTVLFFMTIALITNRKKLDTALELLNEVRKLDIEESFPNSYLPDIRNAKELIQTGMHLSANLNEHYGNYEQMLKNGGKLKILIADPDGHAFDMAAVRFPASVDPEQERSRAKSSLKTLKKLQKEFTNVEIKIIDYLLEYSAMLVNPDSVDSVIYVERYTFKIYGGARKPKRVIRQNEGKWFKLYKHEICELWKVGKLENRN